MTREILPAGHLEASKVEESNLVGAESVSSYRNDGNLAMEKQ